MQTAGPGRRLHAGFNLLSVALLVYAASAVSSAISAALFVGAFRESRGLTTGTLNIAGTLTLLLGLGLAGFCFAFVVAGFSLAYRRSRAEDPEVARAISLAHTLAFSAYGLSIVAGTLLAFGFFTNRTSLVFEVGVVASAPAALAFIAAVMVPAVNLARRPGPTFAWAGGAMAIVGTVGELILALRPLSAITTPDLVTLGGFPLINWNFPFGMTVAGGSLMLWLAYRFVSESARAPPNGASRGDQPMIRESVRRNQR